MLPSDVVKRLLDEGDVVGLLMSIAGTERRRFYFQVETTEKPVMLADYSLGAATAMSATGTGWSEIDDGTGRYHPEPAFEKILYQFFFGVSPGQARVYRRYPSNVDINSLLGTRSIGGSVGFVSGEMSPYRSPSPLSEMWTLMGQHPSFLGYHPYAEPSSITVRLNLYIMRYDVSFQGVDPSGGEEDSKRKVAPENMRSKATIRPVGGHQLVEVPIWVLNAMRQ